MIKKIITAIFLILITSLLTEKYISLQSHTLASQQSWYSYKKLSNSYFLGFMGADDFLFERQSLAGEKLNLGVWFGYQDILYKSPLKDFKTYQLDFRLDNEKSYLWTYLNCDNSKCWALRTSAHPEYPSGLYLILNSGEFTESIPLPQIYTVGRHQLMIHAHKSESEIFIDSKLVKKFSYSLPITPLRFMSSFNPSTIYSISSIDKNNISTQLDFNTDLSFKRLFFIFSLFLTASLFVLYIKKNHSQKWSILFMYQLTILILISFFYIFDYVYWAHHYSNGRNNPERNINSDIALVFENLRKKIFINVNELENQNKFLHEKIWFKPFQDLQQKDMGIGINDFQIIDSDKGTKFKKNIDDEILRLQRQPVIKLGFVGGSQTWGTGATSLNKTWPAQIVADLSKKTHRKVVAINFSICGGVLYNFNERSGLISKFKPDLLIVNFGANDIKTPDQHFRYQLKKFDNILTENKINTLYSIEALSHEDQSPETPKSELIRNFLALQNKDVQSLHNYFKSPDVFDSGHLWHDQLHFTDFGHTQATHFFTNTPAYLDLLQKIKKSTSK